MLQFQTLGVVSDAKVSILGVYRSKVNISQQFSKKSRKTKKKLWKNWNFYAKQVFDQIDVFVWL
ncbi:hypothetical protein FWK35_00017739 [Aphis craccivora]|uniref:Uncharacterized protein n=1 Tax=Aphis craccivora TaxID=307492 RepID=A0A6G0YT65_APHCR|nr:hypothetical protein FWK35_00017739 [Aphis craccivora]